MEISKIKSNLCNCLVDKLMLMHDIVCSNVIQSISNSFMVYRIIMVILLLLLLLLPSTRHIIVAY